MLDFPIGHFLLYWAFVIVKKPASYSSRAFFDDGTTEVRLAVARYGFEGSKSMCRPTANLDCSPDSFVAQQLYIERFCRSARILRCRQLRLQARRAGQQGA